MTRNDTKGLLWENFKQTYAEAQRAYQNKDFDNAATKLRNAADLLSRVAMINSGELKKSQLEKAEFLRKSASALPISKAASAGKNYADARGEGSADEEGGNRSFITKINSRVSFEDIVGLDNVLDLIRDVIISPLSRGDIYAKYGIKAGGAVMMFGPPGTGKTMIAEAIGNELKATYFYVKSSDIKNKYVGETEKTLDAIFNEARANRPAVIFFDEFDDLALRRSEENKVSMAAVPKLLTEIDGVGNSLNDILILTATNIPWNIDTAILSRFEKVYLPLPSKEARKEIFAKKLEKNIQKASDIDFMLFAEKSENYSGRDIKKICEKVRKALAKEEIATGNEQICTNEIVLKEIETQRAYVRTVSNTEKFDKFLRENSD